MFRLSHLFRPGPGRPPISSIVKVVSTRAGGFAVRAKVAPIAMPSGIGGLLGPMSSLLLGPLCIVVNLALEQALRARIADLSKGDEVEGKEGGEI